MQPGVEFGDENIARYNRVETNALSKALTQYPGIVLEGHSTDYQPPKQLKEMVEDGVAILKVGPALTFAAREGLFALSMIEEELIPAEKRANLRSVIERKMLEEPKNWEVYYKGTEEEQKLKRKYSLSDRSRYYFADKDIQNAIRKLYENLDNTHIPLGLLHQYMPTQYIKIRDGKLALKAAELVKDHVIDRIEDYNYATKPNYMAGGIF